MPLIKEEGLIIVHEIDYLRHLICDDCNLCAKDCRYNCRFIREALEEMRSLNLLEKGICIALWNEKTTYLPQDL